MQRWKSNISDTARLYVRGNIFISHRRSGHVNDIKYGAGQTAGYKFMNVPDSSIQALKRPK